MAILSALIAWIGNRLSTLLQAVLGWSVTALFGSLPSAKQTALSGALILSLLWPLTIAGIFFPPLAAWAFAFLPVHKWLGPAVVRWITVGLAAVMPLVIGGITRWVAQDERQGSWFRTVIAGYPLALGYAVACLVTAVTVPLVKVASMLRRWEDEHVFVQPRPGEYMAALRELARAFEAAGTPGVVTPVPPRLRIASTVLGWFARTAVRRMVAEDPQMVRAEGVEAYLYPADMLLRGEPANVGRVRTAMTRTWLERHAFLVSDPGAQELQEELQRLEQMIHRHHDPGQIGWAGRSRLHEVRQELDRCVVPFEQWVMLDRSLHRLEETLGESESEVSDMAVETRPLNPELAAPAGTPQEHEATAELFREAVDETRELVRLEVELAKEELRSELSQAKMGAIALGAGGALALSGITMFFVCIAMAFRMEWLAALILGGILLVVAGVLALGGFKALPRRPLEQTKERIETDLKQLKERVA
ncbi:MAG TPA: phage holin family protein [Polyangiaceae bacterium]